MPDKAVQLYQKGGNLVRALDLCFSARLFDDLRSIADNLGEHTSPAILSRCAEFFMQHQQCVAPSPNVPTGGIFHVIYVF